MTKKLLICALFALAFVACEDEKPALDTSNAPPKAMTSAEAAAKIKAGSIPAGDLFARADRGMKKLMTEYEAAAETIDGFDNPSYTMDKKCNVVFSYEERGTSYEKHFNIGELEHRSGKMSLEADNGDDVLFPGFRVETATGDPTVVLYKEGKEYQKDNEWYIVLANRASVETAAPTVVSIINVCQDINAQK